MKPSNVTFAIVGAVVAVCAIGAMIITGVMAARDENRGETTSPTADVGGPQTPITGETRVEVGDNYLQPDDLAVSAGTEVTFDWVGENAHRLVSSTTGNFETSEMRDGSYSFTFDEPGTFGVHCTIHGEPVMSMTITVVTD